MKWRMCWHGCWRCWESARLDALLGALRPGVDRPDDEGVTATREIGRRPRSNQAGPHDYAILRTYEAGIVLIGNEVKSLRAGHASLAGAFVQEGTAS